MEKVVNQQHGRLQINAVTLQQIHHTQRLQIILCVCWQGSAGSHMAAVVVMERERKFFIFPLSLLQKLLFYSLVKVGRMAKPSILCPSGRTYYVYIL